jgi:hypothetical protein
MTDILKKHPTPWRVERSCVDSDFVCIRDAHETQVVSFVLAIYRHTDIDKVLDFIVSAVNCYALMSEAEKLKWTEGYRRITDAAQGGKEDEG